MSYKRLLAKFRPAFTDDLWRLDLSDLTTARAKFFRFMKLARTTLDKFAENRMGFQCVALSYFGAMAIVPLVAFIFSVTGGLGLSDALANFLHTQFPGNPEIIEFVIDKADNILNTAKSGGVGAISAVLFVWTIIWMMFQTERVFNNIWGIRKIPRKMYKRFSGYFLLLLLIPFIVIIFFAGIALYSNAFSLIGLDMNIKEFAFLKTLISLALFYALATFTISAMYKWIPAPKVKYKFALKSALLSGAVFVIFQYLYLETQMFVGRLNGVYGVLAAIPLFLIWMNMSWQIIMYGAQLCYAYHDVDGDGIPDL